MSLSTGVFLWSPTVVNSSQQIEYKITKTEFQNYTQRQKQGLRPVRRSWRLTFVNSRAVTEAIKHFLDAHSGWQTFFICDPSSGSLVRVIAGDVEIRPAGKTNERHELTAMFQEETASGTSL